MSKFKWSYLWTPKKWVIYARSLVEKVIGVRIPQKDVISYCEQIIYRTLACSDCLENGSCLDCSCKAPDLFLDPDNYCSAEKWDEMDHEKWAEFKKETGFYYKTGYKK